MTAVSLSQLNDVTVHIRLSIAIQDKSLMIGREGNRFTVAEVILEDHDPVLTALYRACSKLRMNVEHTEGPRITEPVVKGCDQDWSYMVPEGWDLSDALGRLPAAFATARPDIARNLKRIEQARRESGGEIDQALDITASLILETGDPQGVYDELILLLGGAQLESDEFAA
ncbi:hypothetical protein ACFW9L_16230 [Streptomyces sp. NPDC059517]|uniref:hypothetical protein n=1 Tax=Streptomyces sp. NPDC059517 TaxID=3346855 RepID=UPI003699D881